MANINSIITYNANLSPAQAQIKALTGQVAGLTTAFNALDRSALKAQRSVAATFAANVGQIGGFTAQTVKATSAVESFGKQLAANKLTMREYFREAITGYTRQSSLMRQLAEQQVRYQQSVAVPIGGGQAMMLTPQSINAASSAAQLASARFSIFNELVNGGATSMLNWGKNTQWAGRQLMVGFTLPLALFAGAMSKQFRELDKELTRFQKVYGSDLGNAVSESTQRMRDQIQQLAYDISSAYGIAAKETAALAADIAATGKEGQELISSVQQTTRLAVLGEVDRQEAMKATLSLQSAFRMNTDELAESINFLNAVENQTSATLEDLATAIPKVGPIVRSLGGDVKDLATLLVAMREGGIPAAEAANALKSGLASLINPTKQAAAVARQFGVDLVGIVEANQGQLMPTIYAMQSALQGLDSFSRSRIIEQIFGKYQFARITALFDNIGRVGSQTQSVIELATKSSAELAAVANGEIKTLTESTAVKFQRTLEQLKNSLMPIGQALTETLIPILEKVGEGIKMFSTFFSALPDSVKGLAKWGVALTALAGPVIMLVGLFGNLVANGLKFGMMIVRLGAKMAGIKTEKFQLLDENLMAAKLGVDNLTSAFTTQEVAMRRLVGALAAYEQSLGRLAVREPGLFVPGAVPATRGTPPIRRQKGSTAPEKVPGGYGGGDRIPALLEPGESVITKEATAKFWPVIEAMNRGNLPGFNRGTIFLGMPRGYKDLQGAKQVKQTLSGTNIEATTGRFATLPVTDIGKKVTSIGGRSSSIPGINGIYEEGGKKYVVKTHDTADSALAEVRGTQLTRDVFGLDTPIQELIKIKHPVTGDVIFAVRSPYDAKFAKSTGVIDEKNFFGQALAAIVRRDKDLQPDNLYGNIVTDVGQAFVANKASQPRIIGGELPGVAEQTATNFLMSKGGAKKWFAETTAPLARTMSEDDYVRGFQTTITEASRKARGAIDNLPYMTKEERAMYSRIIDDLDEAAKIDWRAVYQSHRGITPEVKKPPTAAALAKKEALEAEKARQRGEMARWEYGLPYRFQGGGEVPGGYGGGDKVPAYLEPGEFVITKEATKLNKSFLEAINSGKTPGMYKTGKDSAAGSGQGNIGRAAKLHTVPPDELAKMYYGPGSKSMLGVLGYGGLTTTLHPQYINNTFDKLTGIPSWMKAGIPFNDRAAAQMLSVLIKERDQRGGKVGPEFTRSIQYLQKLIKTPGKARSITLNGYAATTAAAERLAGIIPDTDKAQKARAQQLAAELNKRVGATTSPGRIFSAINRLSMEYIDKAIADPKMRGLIWESTPGTSKTKFKDSLRERIPRFAQSGFLFRGIRMGRFQEGGVGTGEPALLEPGEFVVNSDASAQYAPILRAMNRGTIGRYQDGKDDVTMRPGYNPNDPKYSSPDKTSTGGRHQGHIFGAPVAPGIPAFGKNLQIGGQAVFWHADFWKMITAAENQLANVLAMSAGNRARLMESLSIVGPQFNASQQQIDRIMLAVTNGFMQHEDDVTLYQAALRNLGQRISTGAASVTGSMAGLIKQVESIKITGYSAAEAQAVERRLIAEYQRILSTPGQLAETARIAIAKQLQIVQQQMTATGIATTQMTASLASNIQASAARPFPGGDLVPGRVATQGPQLAGAEQSLTRALQLRERLQLRLIASSERLEKLDAAAARIKADTSLSEQKRKAALDNLTKQYYEELNNNEILKKASDRAEQNLIRAKERAAASYATAQPGGAGGRSGGGNTTFLGMPAIPPRSGATGPDTAMKDPMARMMRGQGLMNVAFMGSMAVGSLGALGVASEDAASKLMLFSTALMALPMLGMMSPKGMATNFLGLKSLGGKMQAAGAARQAAGAAAAPAFGTRWVGNTAANVASGGPKLIPSGMTAGSGLLTAGRALSFLGGPPGIALALGITAVVTAYMLYKKAADEARERAIASFEDPAKSAEYFGETIDDLAAELENRSGRFEIGDMVDIDPELRKIVGEEYAPLIDRLKYSQAEDGARQLSLAYNNMLINGLSAENAQATLKAIAAEAGAQGGAAYSEAFSNSMLNAENVEEAITRQMDLLNPERNKALVEKLQSQLPSLDAAVMPARMDNVFSQFKLLGEGIKDIAFPGSGGPLNIFRMFSSGDPVKEGMEIAGEFFGGFNKVWTAATADIFDSTVEARAKDAAVNAADQARTSIQELMSLSADSFNAATTDFMKAYEDAPEKVLESIQTAATWVEATDDNLEIMKTGLIELNPILEGLINTLETPAEIGIFKQLLTVGLDPMMFFDENGFNEAAAATSAATMGFYDELDKKNKETFDELKENTIEFIDEEIKATNKGIRKINDYWDSWAKVTRKEQRQAQKDYDKAQRRSENFIDGKQDEIEAIEDTMDARREEFDEKMQGLQDEKDLINESTDKYIDSLNKRKEADSFYAQQRKTSLGALQKLASGDVFGFLQDRQQMSADAQTFSYDQMIAGIEDRRNLEVDAIDETMEKERRRQEEWEKAQRDKIDGINDLIDAERDLMEERTKAHEKDLRQFEKRQKTIETNRKQDLKGERIKLADLTKAREKAEALELADYEEMSNLLGEKYKDRYDKQIYQLQREQFFIRYNTELYKEKQEMATNPEYTPRSNNQILSDAFTAAFGTAPGPAQGGVLGQSVEEILKQMGVDPNNPQVTLNNPDARTPGAATGGYIKNGRVNLSDGGGGVTGPGGPKSDVIPAMLSNGEYVIQASSVKKYGTDLMNTINAGKYAYGGYVGSIDAQEARAQGNVYGGIPRPKTPTTYTYTPGATNSGARYTPSSNFPPNITRWFDTNRRYQHDMRTPDNNYKAHGIYSSKSYVPYAQDALDARTMPDGYSGGKKWRENMSRLTNLGLNSAEFFNQWRNLRRWEKEQFIRSLENVSINQPPPTVIERGLPGKLVVPEDRGPIDSYSVPWWLSQPKSFLPPESKPYPVYPGRPESGDTGNWPQRQNAGTALVNWIKALFGGDGPKIEYWNDPYRGWVPKPTGYANGGVVGFKNGSSNPTWYSADRAEQAATGTRGTPKPQYSGGTPTYSGGYSSANTQATQSSGYKSKIWKQPKIKTGGGFIGDMIFEGLRQDFADFINTTLIPGSGGNLENLIGMNVSGNRFYGQRSEMDKAIGNALFGLNFVPLPFLGPAVKALSSFGSSFNKIKGLGGLLTNPSKMVQQSRIISDISSQVHKSNTLEGNIPELINPNDVQSVLGTRLGKGLYTSNDFRKVSAPTKRTYNERKGEGILAKEASPEYRLNLSQSAWEKAISGKGYINWKEEFIPGWISHNNLTGKMSESFASGFLQKHLAEVGLNDSYLQSLISKGYIGAASKDSATYVNWLPGVEGSGWGLKKLSDGGLVPKPTGYAGGGIVRGFRDGGTADRQEGYSYATKPQNTKPKPTTYYGSTTNVTSPYTYTPGWSPTPYRLPAQRYGPYGVGRIPGTRKPYNIPELGRTADLSAMLASNYSHKLGAYATTSQHLEYLRKKASERQLLDGGGGKKWNIISSILSSSSPLTAGARDRLTGSARDIPTLDYWRTLSREQKAWFLEYATTGNTNNWSNSRIFKLMPWLPAETAKIIERGLPGKLRVPMDRGAPTALNAYPNTVTIGQDGVAPTAPGSTNRAPYGLIPGTNIPVPRPPGAPATSGYPMGWDTTTRVPMDRPAKPSGSNYIWDPQRRMWVSIENVGAGTSWGWPWDGSGTRDNIQSPIRFKPGMTPDTTRTSPQEQYPIGMSGIYLGTSTWLGRTLEKFSSGQPISLGERSSLKNLYEILPPTEKSKLVSEIYKRVMPSRESISFRSLNEMSSIQRGASLRTLGNETGYELDLIRRGNGGLVQKFAEGGAVYEAKEARASSSQGHHEYAYSQNGWPYLSGYSAAGLQRGIVPGTNVGITTHKDVLPLFLSLAQMYNSKIRKIDQSQTAGFGFRDNQTNHRSGTALDINWSEEGALSDSQQMYDWWSGKSNTWSKISPNPARTAVQIRDWFNQFGEIIEWYGSSRLGGDLISGQGYAADWMHWQISQRTKPGPERIREVMDKLGIQTDGTGATGTLETPGTTGTSAEENKKEKKEKSAPRMGLAGILNLVNSGTQESDETDNSGTTTTNIETGSGGDWLRSFIASKGVSGEVAKTLWAIGMKESGGDPGKLYPQKTSYNWNSSGFPRFDTGLFQINNIHLDKVKNAFGRNATMQDMLDPEKNWTIMEQLSSNFTKWNPWGIATDMVSPDWTGWPATSWSKEESFNRYMSYRNQFAGGGIVKMFSDGGKVSGPGGPRSDMIPAMLSNGEYVVKASSVAKYGKDFMDEVNAGQLNFGGGGMAAKYASGGMVNPARFADGGFVGSMTSAPMPTFGMPQMTSVSPTDISSSINNVGGSSNSSSSNTSNVKVIINGAGGKSAKAIANRVISIINEANGRRNHSRSI